MPSRGQRAVAPNNLAAVAIECVYEHLQGDGGTPSDEMLRFGSNRLHSA
jgi:hypothetical protein